jgi:hypothetical protein
MINNWLSLPYSSHLLCRSPDANSRSLRTRLKNVRYFKRATRLRKTRVEDSIKPNGERIHALSQPKLQVMNIGATRKRADCLAQTIMIIVQQRQPFSKPKERGFAGRL